MQRAVRRAAACVVVPAAIGRAADGGSIPAASTIPLGEDCLSA
jgi:hypothetical protein